LTVRIEKGASYDEIKEAIKAAADGPLNGMQLQFLSEIRTFLTSHRHPWLHRGRNRLLRPEWRHPFVHLRRKGRYLSEQELRQARLLVRQRVGLLPSCPRPLGLHCQG
jgi:hypothetical protein